MGGLGMEWRYWGHKDGNGRLQDGGEDHEVSEGGWNAGVGVAKGNLLH